MKRRHFLKAGAAAAGTLLFDAFPYHAFAGTTKKFASDRVILGDTGIEVSRLAMGTGTSGFGNSSNQKRKLGLKGLTNLLRTGYDEGVFFWESADQYGTHPHLKEALKAVEFDKVDEALQYALAQEYLDSFTIGSENIDEFEDLTKKIPEASVRG